MSQNLPNEILRIIHSPCTEQCIYTCWYSNTSHVIQANDRKIVEKSNVHEQPIIINSDLNDSSHFCYFNIKHCIQFPFSSGYTQRIHLRNYYLRMGKKTNVSDFWENFINSLQFLVFFFLPLKLVSIGLESFNNVTDQAASTAVYKRQICQMMSQTRCMQRATSNTHTKIYWWMCM